MLRVVPPVGPAAIVAGDWIRYARPAEITAIAAASDRIRGTVASEITAVASTEIAAVAAQVATIAAARDRIRGAIPNVVTVSASDIRVAIEVVEVVDCDVVAAPSTSPAPTTAPKCSHSDANPE